MTNWHMGKKKLIFTYYQEKPNKSNSEVSPYIGENGQIRNKCQRECEQRKLSFTVGGNITGSISRGNRSHVYNGVNIYSFNVDSYHNSPLSKGPTLSLCNFQSLSSLYPHLTCFQSFNPRPK